MSDQIVFGPWVGAVTATSSVIKAGIENGASVRLLVSENSDLTGAQSMAPSGISASPEMTVFTFEVDGLDPDREYHYALEVNGEPALDRRGRFRTFPPPDAPASFTFACAGDAKGGETFRAYSNHEVFDHIRGENPLFFLHLGDLHYANIGSTNVADHVETYREVLNKPRQAQLYREVPLAYIWDDHDFCGNASDARAAGRRAARLAYQRCVPHYPLAEGEGDVAIYQAFTVGRVRVLVTDTRSMRANRTATDNSAKTMLGARQKQWLKDELLAGKDRYPLLVWVNSVPWIGDPNEEDDDTDAWYSYSTERSELGSFIEENDIRNVLMLHADAHMIALDDGSNNRGSTGVGGFPVFCAAPLDRPNSRKVKGEPFSHGIFDRHKGQYGLITINDEGGPTVSVTITGKRESAELVSLPLDFPR
ncbi:MAG: alkaline phosphatase D family protein [Acidobacteriota bacterium]